MHLRSNVVFDDAMLLCDLCHTNDENGAVYFRGCWGLFVCRACACGGGGGEHHSNDGQLRKHCFIHWEGKLLLSTLKPIWTSRRLACEILHKRPVPSIRVLARPAFDPYTGERCGPLITQQELDEKMDQELLSPTEALQALVASLDGNREEQRRRIELRKFADDHT